MHMSDALVNPTVALSMYACSAVVAGYSMRKINADDNGLSIATMAVLGAFVFAAQMINFAIPGTGASGHLTGAILLTAILGPSAAFVTLLGILFVQSLLFADGGLLALGCNIWNMAFYGCFVGGLLFRAYLGKRAVNRKNIAIVSVVSSVLALQLGAFSVVAQTVASGITDLPFRLFVSAMQPIHLAIGLVEGLITAAILSFVFESRPELLWFMKQQGDSQGLQRNKRMRWGFALAFVLVGGVLSHFASANPDGLEWSVAKTAVNSLEATPDTLHALSAKAQQLTALFPHYSLKDSDAASGTTISGILGGILVLAMVMLIGLLAKRLAPWLSQRAKRHV